MEYKGINKDKIKEIAEVRFKRSRFAEFDVEEFKKAFETATETVKAISKTVEEAAKKYADDMDMCGICEMALLYLDEMKFKSRRYEEGINVGWELARKIWLPESKGGMNADTVKDIFGCDYYEIAGKYTVKEALAKMEAYEKAKDEIKIGDVVYADDEPDSYGIVTGIFYDEIYVLWYDGSCGEEYSREEIHKTGRTVNIADILKEIGKE